MPIWIEAPTYAEAAAAYPARAKADHVAGGAELTCSVTYKGALRDCAVLTETAGGYGFGSAARKLAERLRAAPGSPDAPYGGEMRVTFAFPPEMATGAPYVAAKPAWAALPAASDFQASFPPAANGVNSVRVVLGCKVAAGGALADCQIESEAPAGQGYGAGALALAPKIRVGLLTVDGVPLVGAGVRVPVRYELQQAPPKP